MPFATLAGLLWGILLAASTLWAGRRIPAGRGGWLLLSVALASVPWVPAPHVPIRVERALYAGPDLLGDAPVREVVVGDSPRAAGLTRVRQVRRVQGETLLSESRRVELRLPWLWAMALAWAGLLGAARDRGARASPARTIVVLSAGALAAGACGGEAAPSLAELRLREVMEMRGTGDVTGIEAVFLSEAVYEDVAGDYEYRGVPEIADHLGRLHEWASGVFLDVVAIHAGGEWAAAEWLLEGTQSGPVPGLLDSVTGRRFRLRGVTLVEVERGGVVRAVDYLDWVPFLLDVGAEIHLPGGGVTSRPGAADEGSGPGDSGSGPG